VGDSRSISHEGLRGPSDLTLSVFGGALQGLRGDFIGEPIIPGVVRCRRAGGLTGVLITEEPLAAGVVRVR